MKDTDLPSELGRLERELAERPRPAVPPALRRRVLAAVPVELRRQQRRARWAFAAQVAAAALLWLNLSLSATTATQGAPRRRGDPRAVRATAREIRRLLPGLSPREALACATALRAGTDLRGCPPPPARPLVPRVPTRQPGPKAQGG